MKVGKLSGKPTTTTKVSRVRARECNSRSKRGRIAGRLTLHRRRALEEIEAAARAGKKITLSELARRINVHDYRAAKRIMRDIDRYALTLDIADHRP